MIWSVFKLAEVDLFTQKENTLCLIFFSLEKDALTHEQPKESLYAFPLVALTVGSSGGSTLAEPAVVPRDGAVTEWVAQSVPSACACRRVC